jgi:hypothetical protein
MTGSGACVLPEPALVRPGHRGRGDHPFRGPIVGGLGTCPQRPAAGIRN